MLCTVMLKSVAAFERVSLHGSAHADSCCTAGLMRAVVQQASLHRAGRQHYIGTNIKTSAASTQAAPVLQGKAEALIPMRQLMQSSVSLDKGSPVH